MGKDGGESIEQPVSGWVAELGCGVLACSMSLLWGAAVVNWVTRDDSFYDSLNVSIDQYHALSRATALEVLAATTLLAVVTAMVGCRTSLPRRYGLVTLLGALACFVLLDAWALTGWPEVARTAFDGSQTAIVGDDQASLLWLTATLGAGAVGAAIVATLLVRRSLASASPVALIASGWIVLGSGVGRPATRAFRPNYEVVVARTTVTPFLVGGVILAIVALCLAVRSIRSGARPVESLLSALSSFVAIAAIAGAALSLSDAPRVVGHYVEGRPTRRRGRPIIPTFTVRPCAGELSPVGIAWVRAAAEEASSVTAFLELAVGLERLRAPTDLVDRCLLAARDERRHVRLCLAIARDLGVIGSVAARPPLAAGTIGRSLSRRRRLRRVVIESVVDGMLGEGFASSRLASASEHSADPSLVRVLRSMSRDEDRHAALARDIVAWADTQEPTITARAVEDALASIPDRSIEPTTLDRASDAERAAGGMVSREKAQACFHASVERVHQQLAMHRPAHAVRT